jgi:Ca2+-binding RTX toxin-like protein
VSSGVVINLSASALTGAAISSATGTAALISTGLTQVPTNSVAYLGGTAVVAPYSGVSPVLDTLVSIENVIGSDGTDYIVGSSSANVINGGLGADTLSGGAGIDTYRYAAVGANSTASDSTVRDSNTDFDLITFVDGTDLIAIRAGAAGTLNTTATGFEAAADTAIAAAAGTAAGTLATRMFATGANGAGDAGDVGTASDNLLGYVVYTATGLQTAGVDRTFLIIDVNDDGLATAVADIIIEITGNTVTWTSADFALYS